MTSGRRPAAARSVGVRARAPSPNGTRPTGRFRFLLLVGVLVAAGLAGAASPIGAQERDASLRVRGPGGETGTLRLVRHRGYLAVPASELGRFGWAAVPVAPGQWRLTHGRGVVLTLATGTPFFSWGDDLLQLTSEPYLFGDGLHLPLQLVIDFFPSRLPSVYSVAEPATGADRPVLVVEDGSHWPGSAGAGVPGPPPPVQVEPGGGALPGRSDAGAGGAPPLVVVIDPGHGGSDPGAVGPGGTREKDVALGIARAIARELERYPTFEVHLTRDGDELVPLWQRGEDATRLKGDRPGVFLSLHANALPDRRSVRGFETYFLSEARTEHERRVAANENAPLALERGEGVTSGDPELDFILKELRNLDHAHWSSLLANLVQERLSPVHPGPNRGVKQGPFAVITNALMPAVLIETGFITNPAEEEALARSAFQESIAVAIAGAVVDFFERYPPGRGTTLDPPARDGP